jgi:hypothetical protein
MDPEVGACEPKGGRLSGQYAVFAPRKFERHFQEPPRQAAQGRIQQRLGRGEAPDRKNEKRSCAVRSLCREACRFWAGRRPGFAHGETGLLSTVVFFR